MKKQRFLLVILVLLLLVGITLVALKLLKIIGDDDGSTPDESTPEKDGQSTNNILAKDVELNNKCKDALKINDLVSLMEKVALFCEEKDLTAANFEILVPDIEKNKLTNYVSLRQKIFKKFPTARTLLDVKIKKFSPGYMLLINERHVQMKSSTKWEDAYIGKKGNCNEEIKQKTIGKEVLDYFSKVKSFCTFEKAAFLMYLHSAVAVGVGEYSLVGGTDKLPFVDFSPKTENIVYLIRFKKVFVPNSDSDIRSTDKLVIKTVDTILEETGFNNLVTHKSGNLRQSDFFKDPKVCKKAKEKLLDLVLTYDEHRYPPCEWGNSYYKLIK